MWYRVFIALILFLRLLSALFASHHSLNDDISIIRQRVLQSMIWPTNQTISAVIRNAILYTQKLNNSCYWPDIDYRDQSIVVWKTEEHMFRLTTMIQALTVPGSTVHNDTKLRSAIHCALNVWLINDWRNPNWYFNQIGIPLQATSQLLMLGDNVTSSEIEKIKEISYRAAWWNGGGQTTGANLVWMIQIQLYRSLATHNITGIEQAEHVGQGTLNLFTTNTNDYDYIFPLLDWQAINGITVEHDIPLEPCIHGSFNWKRLSFVGGVSDGHYGLAIMDTASHNLTTQRSWHFYDDAIIVLATNLTLTTSTTAWTTLASRLLTIGQISVGFFNSTIITFSDGNYSFPYIQNKTSNVQWIHVGGTNIGYLLQIQGLYSELGASLGTKTGNYHTIGPFNYTITERILTIWINHGKGPYTLDYGYIILPNVSLQSMPTLIKQYDEEKIFSCLSTNNQFHGTMWPTLKRASFVLWDNISTTFSCNSSLFQITIQLSDAGAYLFSETTTDFTITASHPTRVNGNMRITLDRMGYGDGCNMWSYKNTSYTNMTLPLPCSSELQGASVNITCRKQNFNKF